MKLSKADIQAHINKHKKPSKVEISTDTWEKLFKLKLLYGRNKTFIQLVEEAVDEYYENNKNLIEKLLGKGE